MMPAIFTILTIIVAGLAVWFGTRPKKRHTWHPHMLPLGIVPHGGEDAIWWTEGQEWWNRQLDLDLFESNLIRANQAVTVHDTELPLDAAMRTTFRYDDDGLIVSARIDVDFAKTTFLGDVRKARAARHELAHVLGWEDHSENPLSVMYANLSPTDEPILPAKTRALLRGLYG